MSILLCLIGVEWEKSEMMKYRTGEKVTIFFFPLCAVATINENETKEFPFEFISQYYKRHLMRKI